MALARGLYYPEPLDAPRDHLFEAVQIATDVHRRYRQVMGAAHPETARAKHFLGRAELALEFAEARESRDLERLERLMGRQGEL